MASSERAVSRSASSARSSERCEAGTFSGSASPSLVTVKVPSGQRGDVPVPHALGRQLRCLRRVAGGRRRARRVARARRPAPATRRRRARRAPRPAARACRRGRRGADVHRVCAVHSVADCQVAEHPVPGWAVSRRLIRTWRPATSTAAVVLPDPVARGLSGSRRRRISRSISASVPAVRRCAPVGSRTAPTRSAGPSLSRRAAGLTASSVNSEVSTATTPPGRIRASALTMKWLCRLWPRALCRRSCSRTSANGTLPTATSKTPAG